MKLRIIFIVALAVVVFSQTAISAPNSASTTADAVSQDVRGALRQVSELERWLNGHCQTDCGVVWRTVDRLRRRLRSLDQKLHKPQRLGPEAMAPAMFDRFIKSVSAAYYVSSKLEVLKHQVSYSFFDTAQVKTILDQFYYTSSKMQVLQLLAPRVIDPENAFIIIDSFYYASSKQQARQILSRA